MHVGLEDGGEQERKSLRSSCPGNRYISGLTMILDTLNAVRILTPIRVGALPDKANGGSRLVYPLLHFLYQMARSGILLAAQIQQYSGQ